MKEALYIAAAAQLTVVVLNLFLMRIMKWEESVARMPQLVREVFLVHAWFITITLVIFGVVTFRFVEELAASTNDLGRWLATGKASVPRPSCTWGSFFFMDLLLECICLPRSRVNQ